MGTRAFDLLTIATLDANERDAAWQALCDGRTEAATRAILRDYARRGFVTAEDYRTMQLTEAGVTRRNAGQAIIATRAAP